jgi:hypothetical protein
MRANRLVGLHPVAGISGSQLILRAPSYERAQVRSAAIELDLALLEDLQAGDDIELVRTATADVAVRILRAGDLRWAVGAVTTISLGTVRMRGGSAEMPSPDKWPRRDTWVEALIDGQTSILRDGDELTLGQYRVTLVRAFKHGVPGQCENAAISCADGNLHDAAIRAAAKLRSRNAAMELTDW